MFGTIIVTIVITVLFMTTLYLYGTSQKKDVETNHLRRMNDSLNKQISEYVSSDQQRREQNAYSKGLYDGRKTDAIYRSMLSKYSKGEQATMFMQDRRYSTNDNGEDEVNE